MRFTQTKMDQLSYSAVSREKVAQPQAWLLLLLFTATKRSEYILFPSAVTIYKLSAKQLYDIRELTLSDDIEGVQKRALKIISILLNIVNCFLLYIKYVVTERNSVLRLSCFRLLNKLSIYATGRVEDIFSSFCHPECSSGPVA